MEEKRIKEEQGICEEQQMDGAQDMTEEKENTALDGMTEKEAEITVDGLSEEEAVEVREIFKRFVKAYQESGEDQETFEWLEKQLREELPDRSEEEIHEIKEEIIESIREYDKDLEDMTEEIESGKTKEKWFADRIEAAATGVSVNNYGNYLNQINATMEEANRQMLRTVLRRDGGINECINLDGFIAEQYHVNNFNAKAALRKSDFRAEVCVPKPGESYGKNSFDVRIWNSKTDKVVHQYQFKFGKDAEATKRLLESGDYHNQRYVVPAEQVQELQEAFPTKTVTDYIGGTDKVDIASDPLSKADIKQMQTEVQESHTIPKTDWNIYSTKELALNLGKQAGVAGIQSALITTGFDLAGRVMKGESIDGEEVVETALRTGADAGIKAAAGGALTVASKRGIISLLPPGTLPGTIAKVACVGIENVKIMWKVAKGELTMSEALEQMGRTSTAMTAGLCCAGVGAGVGAAALSFIPVVGTVVGGLVGGMAGYMAGNKFGEKVFNGVKKVAEKGKEVVKKSWEGIKNAGRKIKDGFLSLFS